VIEPLMGGEIETDEDARYIFSRIQENPILKGKLASDDGEAIAYNPDDGFLYHASGHSGSCGDNNDGRGGGGFDECVIFERIDNTAGPLCATTDIDISSTALINEEAQALTYWSAEQTFLWKQDHGPGPLFTVNTDGEETEIGITDHQAKGLAFAEGPACFVSCDPPSGALFPVGQTGVECHAVPFDFLQRSDPGFICGFEVDVSEDCGESLTGWWRVEFHATQECDPENAQEFENELRYLRFDENNELVENLITDSGPVKGNPECIQVFYPSTGGPNYLEVRYDNNVVLDTNRSITAHSFDPLTGDLSMTELVDVPTRSCIGEEGSTIINGQVSGDTMTGTWEFQYSADAGLFGNCFGETGHLCGPFEGQRIDNPPPCDIVTPN